MALDDTRQVGVDYIKNFAAVCTAGLIILILLIAFPLVLGGLVAVNPGTGTPLDSIAGGLTYALQYLAMCVLPILSLVKSGTWARDIVSGFRPWARGDTPRLSERDSAGLPAGPGPVNKNQGRRHPETRKGEETMAEERKSTYITLHRNFVRTDIEYLDPKSGEKRSFNSVTLPKGTVVEGRDVSYYQFSPMFVNPSKYRGENFVDIPLLTNKEVWPQRSILDAEGRPVIDEQTGRPAKDAVKVMPAQIKTALEEARREYLAQRGPKSQSLGDRAAHAREGASALSESGIPFDKPAR